MFKVKKKIKYNAYIRETKNAWLLKVGTSNGLFDLWFNKKFCILNKVDSMIEVPESIATSRKLIVSN